LDNIKYIYGVALNEFNIQEEYLYYYPKGRPSIIFDRLNTNEYRFTKDIGRQKDIKTNTPDNTLYLSKSANLNYEPTVKVVKRISDNVIIIDQDAYLTYTYGIYTKGALLSNKDIKDKVTRLVKKADSGIVTLDVIKRELSDDFAKGYPQEFRDILIDDESKVVETTHMGLDQEKVIFGLSDEAGGTRKIFNIAGPFIDVLINGKLLVIDELETSLHPILIRYLLHTFNNPKFNKNGAQLIFTTHNTSLLRTDILRRDQIWLAEKRKDQSTDLRSVFEYKARKGENMEKGYLSGRYGAIPMLD
jgi:AAA15 family ATPase/GTPase